MVLPWVSLRKHAQSYRVIAAILLFTLFSLTLRSLVHPRPLRVHLHQHPKLHVDPKVDLPPLANHTLTPNGLLLLNPDAPHPIFQLIRDAEAAWDAKCARASKTLDEAVEEYRRRYRRLPPLGFDKWWDYVVKHHVQLPDEYDEILHDIEPFWGIDPYELANTQQELETRERVVTVQKTDDHPRFEFIRSTLPEDKPHLLNRINNIIALVREVEHELPPMRVTFSPYDNPNMVSDWQIKNMALQAAAEGEALTRADMPPVTKRGWIQACPPDSPARRHPPTYPPSTAFFPPSERFPKTFIASHRDAMDPCMHPSLLTTHGQFLAHKRGPLPQRTLVPLFSLCSTLLHHDIRPPVPYDWNLESDSDPDEDDVDDEGGAFEGDFPWDRKKNKRLGWRGSTTGMYASPDTWWVNGQRERLVTFTNTLEGNVGVLGVHANESEIESFAEVQATASPVGEPENVPLARVNPVWMDVAFTGNPIGCDKDRGTCDEITRSWAFREEQKLHEQGQYKFIFDVDGNGWSGRFKRLITSNSLIFKATVYPEWYTPRIAPWVHYVPIQMSYEDLYDAVSFFRAHDALGRRIARAGRAWSRRFWRKEDMTAYLYRLLLEYARVTSLDREAMDYEG